MVISSKKTLLKITYLVLIAVWLLLTAHLFYLYVYEVSPKKPIKGGTLVEAGVGPAFYLPYSSDSDKYKFYQSLLFRGCLSPYVSGTQILYKQDLCKVETENYRDFYVYLATSDNWSDQVPISLDDVYFTYKNILVDNKFNFKYLDKYKNIKVSRESNFVKVSFPYPSKDNLIFFTNFILPKHILETKDKEFYLQKFPTQLVNSTCASIRLSKEDRYSILFDLKKCQDYYINNFQYKFFENIEDMKEYIATQKKKIVDFYFYEENLSGYQLYPYILNNYLVMFFNSQSLNIDLTFKKAFISRLNNILTGSYYKYFVKVNDFFKFEPGKVVDLKKYFSDYVKHIQQIRKQANIQSLPKEIILTGSKQEYYFDKNIEKKYALNFVLPQGCDRVGVRYNSGQIYWLRSYKRGEKIAYYNISPIFKNIKKGENSYEIVCEKSGKTYSYFVDIWWKEKPKIKVEPQEIKVPKIRLVYYEDKATKLLIDIIKSQLKKEDMVTYFDIIGVDNIDQFKGIIMGNNYDIVLIGLYLGLKRDIGDIFMSDNPLINPSKYKNMELKSLYSQYLIAEGKTKDILENQIMKIYNQTLPIYFIGKYIDRYGQRSEIENPIFPKRLYNLWLRKDYIKDVKILYRPEIQKDKVLNIKNFLNWIKEKIK